MINRLVSEIKKKNAPIVVGLDPTLKLIPDFIKEKHFKEKGNTLDAVADAIMEYNTGLVDAVCDLVPAVKPQIAMYEQFGIPGLIAFKETVDYCKKKGLVVIGDIKRGDIGSTSEAYAVGHLSGVTVNGTKLTCFDEDFVTVNPYLGTDGIKPF
ncbi:MAG: orotidine-5'-phosphate decarboxylase, partial [Lachnospiraceae bacterium]|nr:orotidine-5'-phosphate decarboxylase [Lachnospiraceae bacterium]